MRATRLSAVPVDAFKVCSPLIPISIDILVVFHLQESASVYDSEHSWLSPLLFFFLSFSTVKLEAFEFLQ